MKKTNLINGTKRVWRGSATLHLMVRQDLTKEVTYELIPKGEEVQLKTLWGIKIQIGGAGNSKGQRWE